MPLESEQAEINSSFFFFFFTNCTNVYTDKASHFNPLKRIFCFNFSDIKIHVRYVYVICLVIKYSLKIKSYDKDGKFNVTCVFNNLKKLCDKNQIISLMS